MGVWTNGYLDECQPIEILSPPYWARTTHWENDIQRIFSSRMGRYNPISAREINLYYELNNTTSIHVHVGNGVDPDSSFPFHTVRNLALILLVYEPAMDQLLDAKLYPPPTLIGNRDRSQDVSNEHPWLSLAVSRLVRQKTTDIASFSPNPYPLLTPLTFSLQTYQHTPQEEY